MPVSILLILFQRKNTNARTKRITTSTTITVLLVFFFLFFLEVLPFFELDGRLDAPAELGLEEPPLPAREELLLVPGWLAE
jgi:hypothetical protein